MTTRADSDKLEGHPPLARTAREVVELYNLVVWNEQDLPLAAELFADEVVRHGVDEVTTLTREQAVDRVRDLCASARKVTFELPVVVAGDDGRHVAIVYQADVTNHDGTKDGIASIEVFRVIDGQITDVYNNVHQHGRWR